MRHPLTIVHVALLRLEMAAALVAGTVILLIMTMGLIEIAGRGLFNKPIHGYLDIVEQLMVAVAVFGVSYCQATWGNVRMTLVVGALNGRARWIAEAASLLLALGVVAILIDGSWNHFVRAWQIGGSTPEIRIPTWIGIVAVPVSLSVLALRLAVQLADAVRLSLRPEQSPLVLPETAAGGHGPEAPGPVIEGDAPWTR